MTHLRRRGFTMIEAIAAVGLVAVLLIVAINTVGASNANQYRTARRVTAGWLAQDLLNAILQQAYKDPGAAPVFGIEAGESTSSRANYDDVDDFHNWTESAPADASGAPYSDLAGWSRSAAVHWVTLANPNVVSATDTGLKRITVNVFYKGQLAITSYALKGSYP